MRGRDPVPRERFSIRQRYGVDGFAAEPAGELLEIAEIFFDGGRAMFFIDELTAIAVDHMRLQIMA